MTPARATAPRMSGRLTFVVLLASLVLGMSSTASANRPLAVVRVPKVSGDGFSHAYARLHAAGLRVSYPRSFYDGTLGCEPTIGVQRPRPGSPLARGGFVTLTPRRLLCSAESPGLPTGRLPRFRVPDFVGRTVRSAELWADSQQLYWQADALPALHDGDAAHLLDNYVVRRQSPKPGSMLTLGVGHKLPHGGGTFRPTPMTVAAVQRP